MTKQDQLTALKVAIEQLKGIVKAEKPYSVGLTTMEREIMQVAADLARLVKDMGGK